MSEIRQVLGIDATKAIEELKALDRAYANFNTNVDKSLSILSNFNQHSRSTINNLRRMRTAAEQTAAAFSKVQAAARTAGPGATSQPQSQQGIEQSLRDVFRANDGLDQMKNKANATSNAVQNLGNQTRKSSKQASDGIVEWTVSWETLARVVATQFIVRTMSQIRDLFRESVGEAVEFQRVVSRIQTIDNQGTSFGNLSQGVRELSDAFNIPLLEAGEGVYQAISNQIGTVSESLRFSAEAAKLARTTNSSLANSIDLVSGAMKSYQIDIEDTDRVTSLFFNAIDKGRITADELANTFGRVGPAAAQIGIPLEEVLGALSAITVQGVKTSESLTQFRGIVTALTKPTVAMREAISELGFATVEQAIATRGLDGLLSDLADSTGDSTREFAKLFPNVRGIGGALALTSDDVKLYSELIADASDITGDFIDQKYADILATDAESVSAAFNRLSNELTTTFGAAVLEVGGDMLEFVGGVDNLLVGIRTLTPGLVSLAGSLAKVAVAAKLVPLAFTAIQGHPLVAGVTAASLAISALPAFIERSIDEAVKEYTRGFDELKAREKERLEELRKSYRDELKFFKDFNGERVQSARESIQEIGREYFRDVENNREANNLLVNSTRSTLNRIVSAREQLVQALRNSIASVSEQVERSRINIASLNQEKVDLDFEFSLQNAEPAVEVFKRIERAQQQAERATRDFVKATRDGNQQAASLAKSQLDAAKSSLQTARNAASRTGDLSLERRVIEAQKGLIDDRIEAERQITRIIQNRQQVAEQELKRQEAIEKQLRQQAKVVLENVGDFSSTGERFNPEELAKRQARRQEALQRIAALSFTREDAGRFDALGFSNLISQLERDLDSRAFAIEIETNVQELKAEFERAFRDLDVKLPFLADLENFLGRDIRGSLEDLNGGLTELVNRSAALRENLASARIDDEALASARRELEASIDAIRSQELLRREGDILEGPTNRLAVGAVETVTALQTIRREIENLSQQSSVSESDLQSLRKQILEFDGIRIPTELRPNVKILIEAVDALKNLSTVQSEVTVFSPEQAEDLKSAEQLLQTISGQVVPQATASLNVMKTSVIEAVNPLGVMETRAQAIARAAERTAEAYVRASQQSLPNLSDSINRQFGGSAYFANGGRGVDTIPAYLRKGEFVMNPRSTNRFFSQIQAMNAGHTPSFRDGGSVTNVGDINVTMQSSGAASVDARTLALQIQREIRRGTSRL